jgi:hypothetical protein
MLAFARGVLFGLQPGQFAGLLLCGAFSLWVIPTVLTGVGTRTGGRLGRSNTIWIQQDAERVTFRASLGVMLVGGLVLMTALLFA